MVRNRENPSLPGVSVIFGLAILLSCGHPPTTSLRYHDLIAAKALTSNLVEIRTEPVLCPDVTRFGVVLRAREELSALVDFGPGARLVLEGCTPEAAEDPSSMPTGTLQIEVEGARESRPRKVFSLDMVKEPIAWQAELDLAELSGNAGRIRLRALLPERTRIHLKEFYLTHEVPVAPRRTAPRQVLLISVDTLREDGIAALGGDDPTPHLDRFLAQSQLWTPHYASAPWTKPSHASLLTGQDTEVHGIYETTDAMRPGLRSVAERFRDQGFLTAGLVHDCVSLSAKFGFARGFDDYRTEKMYLAKMVRQVSNWIGDHREESFFYFLHSFDVHSDFHQLPYEGPGVTVATVAERFSAGDYGCRGETCASELLMALNQGSMPLIFRETEILKYLYGKGVTFVDEQLGLLFEDLRRAQVFEEMMIILTSDHGEAFVGPGRLTHGSHWEEVLRVPLIIKWPGGRFAGERRSLATSAVDVAATLADAFALDATDLPGTSLLVMEKELPIFSGTYRKIVIADGVKAILPTQKSPILFDLRRDPQETENVSSERRVELRRFRELGLARQRRNRQIIRKLVELRGEIPSSRSPGLTPEEIERLRALGYLDDSEE